MEFACPGSDGYSEHVIRTGILALLPRLQSAVPLSLSNFSVKLVESGLIAQPVLDELLAAIPATDRPRDGEALARMLVQRQLLTLYQAQAIADGNGKTLVLGNYVAQDQLGRGGMGVVLKAIHRRMDRTVALKVLSAESVKTPSLVERFHREVKAAARLEHPNIVTAYDADEANGVHFLVMQFVDGQDLAAVVRARGPLGVSQAVHCVLQAARGLEYAHKHGVIHRDIKPGNLLLSKDGTLKILDMGLAHIDNPLADRQQDHSLTGSGMVMGTVDYMSPEQALNTRNADARSDQYSLGITLYFLLTGRPAYAGDSAMEKLLAHRDAPLPSLNHLSPELNAIFQKMAAKKPADRFASMTEVIAALASLQAKLIGESTVAYAPMSLPSSPAAATQSDAALAAFLQSAIPGVQTSATPEVAVAAEVSAAEVPTILGSGAVEDTATTWRPPAFPRRQKIARRAGAAAATAIVIGLIAWQTAIQFRRAIPANPNADAVGITQTTSTEQTTPDTQSVAWHGWPVDAPKPAIAPFDAAQAKQHQIAWAKYLDVPMEYTNSIGMKFVLIPPGEFLRGSSPEEQKKYREASPRNEQWLKAITTEGPQHLTILTQPFYLSVYETTQADYQKVLGVNASDFSAGGKHTAKVEGMDTSQFPVDHATWLEAVEFCEKLSLNEQLTVFYTRDGERYTVPAGKGYRLPTEAEWEYACRAGTASVFWTGNDESDLASIAWYKENSDQRPHTVGELAVNPFGLYDTLGNIFEWCHDGSTPGPSSYEQFADRPAIDPVVKPEEQPNLLRKCRGGMFSNIAGFCRPALRNHFQDSTGTGFRVALSLDAVRQALKRTDPKGQASTDAFALEFDGENDYVTVPDFHVAEDQPLTLECIVVAEKPTGPSQALLLASDAYASIGTGLMNWGTVAIWGGKERLFAIKDSILPGKRTHLALTFADDTCGIYVDGKSDGAQPYRFAAPVVKTVEHVLYIGSGGSSSQRFRGRIEGVRVSNRARYSENFSPPSQLQKDDDTLALYRFTEGEGDFLYDSSGNNRHGKITKAKWVKLGKSEQVRHWLADAPKPAVAPFNAEQAKQHQEAWSKYLGVPVEYVNSLGMKFRLIPPGEFAMGSTPAEVEAALKLVAPQNLRFQDFLRSEGPQHRVVLTKPFYLGVTEVTQTEYQTISGVQPSHFAAGGAGQNDVAGLQTGRHPVENVSWLNAVDFCNRLSRRSELTETYRVDGSAVEVLAGNGYRLPTEAEWEFACRAGTATMFSSGSDEADLASAGWVVQNGAGRTHPVGELAANPFGLFDMHGNLWEWCQDRWRIDSYALANVARDTGTAALSEGERVVRGGSWSAPAFMCRSGMRNSFASEARDFNTGFRLALSVEAVRQAIANIPSLLAFDGDGDYVEVAKFPPCGINSVMLEAWVRPKSEIDAANIISWLGPNWISLFQSGEKWGVSKRLDNGSHVMISDATVVPDEWVHLAATSEGDQLKLYVNGKPAALERIEFPLEPTEQGLYLGGCPVEKLKHDGERWFHGDIRQVRISQGIRNSTAFFPEQEFAVDDATQANFDFRKRDDGVLHDLTGNLDLQGKIFGAKWKALATDDEFALEFDGEKAWVSLPLKDDRDPPWTLEAWVKRRKPNRLSTIIAAFEAPRGMGLSEFEYQLEAGVSRENNRMWSVAPSSKPLDQHRFQHVAAVLQPNKLRVFLDGVRVAEVEFQEMHLPSNAAFGVGGYHGIDLFNGWIDEIRISDSARYEENFTPKRRFVADSNTLVLYHCDDGEGDVLTDSSGHDRHGNLQGTKWARTSQVEGSRSRK